MIVWYFELMDELLGNRPSVQAIDGVGIESSASESQEIEENQELVKIIRTYMYAYFCLHYFIYILFK